MGIKENLKLLLVDEKMKALVTRLRPDKIRDTSLVKPKNLTLSDKWIS